MKSPIEGQAGGTEKRWRIAVAGVFMQLCLGSIYAWSVFKIPMMTAHGWSETQAQAPFMTYGAVFAAAVALGGALVDRMGPRIVGTLGGALFGSGIVLGGMANEVRSVELLVVAYGLIAGLGGGLGYVTPIATLIRWFPDRRGLVTGLAVGGYGLGSFALGNLGPALILDLGVARTFYIWGGTSLMIVLAAASILKDPPAGWAGRFGSPGAGAAPPGRHSSTLREALRSGRFWILWTMLLVSMTAGLGLISQLSPMAQELMMRGRAGGVTGDEARAIVLASGAVVAVAGLFNSLGRLAWSWLSDVIGRKAVFALIFASMLLGFPALDRVDGIPVFAGIIFYLLACYGGTMAAMPALAADEFGHEHIGKIYGLLFTASGLASLCGPYLFAAVKETTGGFAHALYAESAVAAFGLMLVILLKFGKVR